MVCVRVHVSVCGVFVYECVLVFVYEMTYICIYVYMSISMTYICIYVYMSI